MAISEFSGEQTVLGSPNTVPLPEQTRHPSPTILPQVPGYEILGRSGRGGMGVVYKARHLRPGPHRRAQDDRSGTPTSTARWPGFKREAEAVAQLQHPNIVQIYEVGEVDGQPFFALEYVDGGSLAQGWMRQAAAAAARRRLVETARPGHPSRPPARHRPPRPEAGQHPAAGSGRQGQEAAIRRRESAVRRCR